MIFEGATFREKCMTSLLARAKATHASYVGARDWKCLYFIVDTLPRFLSQLPGKVDQKLLSLSKLHGCSDYPELPRAHPLDSDARVAEKYAPGRHIGGAPALSFRVHRIVYTCL